jgi:hypothetical protein
LPIFFIEMEGITGRRQERKAAAVAAAAAGKQPG